MPSSSDLVSKLLNLDSVPSNEGFFDFFKGKSKNNVIEEPEIPFTPLGPKEFNILKTRINNSVSAPKDIQIRKKILTKENNLAASIRSTIELCKVSKQLAEAYLSFFSKVKIVSPKVAEYCINMKEGGLEEHFGPENGKLKSMTQGKLFVGNLFFTLKEPELGGNSMYYDAEISYRDTDKLTGTWTLDKNSAKDIFNLISSTVSPTGLFLTSAAMKMSSNIRSLKPLEWYAKNASPKVNVDDLDFWQHLYDMFESSADVGLFLQDLSHVILHIENEYAHLINNIIE